MKALVVTPKDKNEHKFLSDLLRKLRISTRTISEEEIEDLALSKIMKKVDRTKKVNKTTILKKLET